MAVVSEWTEDTSALGTSLSVEWSTEWRGDVCGVSFSCQTVGSTFSSGWGNAREPNAERKVYAKRVSRKADAIYVEDAMRGTVEDRR